MPGLLEFNERMATITLKGRPVRSVVHDLRGVVFGASIGRAYEPSGARTGSRGRRSGRRHQQLLRAWSKTGGQHLPLFAPGRTKTLPGESVQTPQQVVGSMVP